MTDVEIITDKSRISVADVAALFAQAGWTKSRTPEQIGVMLEHTALAVLVKQVGRPVGFARAVSDHVFRAFVEDVIVAEDVRQHGVGRLLMEALEAQMRALGLPRAELTTQRVEFWRKLGYMEKPQSTYLVKGLT